MYVSITLYHPDKRKELIKSRDTLFPIYRDMAFISLSYILNYVYLLNTKEDIFPTVICSGKDFRESSYQGNKCSLSIRENHYDDILEYVFTLTDINFNQSIRKIRIFVKGEVDEVLHYFSNDIWEKIEFFLS